MAVGLITDTYLQDIADAIRAKLQTQDTYLPSEMANAIMSIPTGGGVEIVPFATGTDEQIAAMIDAAHNGELDLQQDGEWSIGDVRTIHINSFNGTTGVERAAQDIDIVITSFDEYMDCGNLMQFDFKDALAIEEKLNTESYDPARGGYGAMPFKTTVVPGIVNALPEWLKERLIEFSVFADSGEYTPSLTTVTGNKLALRSQVEVTNSSDSTKEGQGTFLPYYNTANNKKKKQGHSSSSYANWWFRSTETMGSNYFKYWWEGGSSLQKRVANDACGVVLFGCL